jgi:hypothetical protein
MRITLRFEHARQSKHKDTRPHHSRVRVYIDASTYVRSLCPRAHHLAPLVAIAQAAISHVSAQQGLHAGSYHRQRRTCSAMLCALFGASLASSLVLVGSALGPGRKAALLHAAVALPGLVALDAAAASPVMGVLFLVLSMVLVGVVCCEVKRV